MNCGLIKCVFNIHKGLNHKGLFSKGEPGCFHTRVIRRGRGRGRCMNFMSIEKLSELFAQLPLEEREKKMSEWMMEKIGE